MKYLDKIYSKIDKSFLQNETVVDFAKKLTICLALVYLFCFALESVLPGIVIEVFNFNLLLFSIVFLMTFLLFTVSNSKKGIKKKQQKYAFLLLAFVFLVTMFIVLYRVSLFETTVYLVLTLALIRQISGVFK